MIPNFVTVPIYSNKPSTTPPYKIYFIGRVSPEKGPERFCQLSASSSDQFEWHMVGTGPLLEQCQQAYPKTVHFHGAVTNMDEIWPKVDLLCISSTYEGLPLVLLEAMARGIPVISFDVGSVKEALSELDFIIECYDLDLMRERIGSYFLKSSKERQIIVEREQERVRVHYSKEVIVPKIEDLYEGCLKT